MLLEKFRYIKKEMLKILEIYDEMNNSQVSYEEIEDELEKLTHRFYELQSQLLGSDLSNIPFEEWEGLSLVSEGLLDFSKTHANIDFSLLKDVFYDSINLNGCNVKGINNLDFDENTFNEEFIKKHPDYFPDESVPEEIKKKFFQKKLQFSDLIEYPSLRNCINKRSFNKIYYSPSRRLVDFMGFEDALRLFDEYPQFISFITAKTDNFDSNGVDFSLDKFEKAKNYEEKKMLIYESVVEGLRKSYGIDFPPLEIIPADMKKFFPNVFIKEDELPKETIDNYYSGNLSIGEIRYYKDILQTKDINIGIRKNYALAKIETVFGSVWDFINQIPKELDYVVINYFKNIYTDEDFEQLKSMEINDIIVNAIRKEIQDKRSSNDIDTLITYCQYLPIEEAIPNEFIRKFVKTCGFTILQNYNKKNNYVLDNESLYINGYEKTLLGNMAKHSRQLLGKFTINTEEELKIYLERVIRVMRKSEDDIAKRLINENKKELSTMFPNQFLDYNLAEKLLSEVDENSRSVILSDLELGFNGNSEMLSKIINEYPSLISVIENKDIIISGILYKKMFDLLGSKKFLEINSVYGNAISHLISHTKMEDFEKLLIELQNNENFVDILNNEVYKLITSKRDFDIRCLPDSFKKSHPELYLEDNAPESLVNKFYGLSYSYFGTRKLINPADLQLNPDWIQYLKHVDLDKCLEEKQISVYNSSDGREEHFVQIMSFYKALGIKFSQEEILAMFSLYGDILWNTNMYYFSLDIGLEKDKCYEFLLARMYREIANRHSIIRKNMPEEFKNKYSDLFLEENAPEELQNLFYQRKISPEIIQLHPEWVQFLIDKNIRAVCDYNILAFVNSAGFIELTNKRVLELFKEYGNYLLTYNIKLAAQAIGNEDEFIKKQIIESITQKRTSYDASVKKFIGSECPDLFLDENAPEELKKYFYNSSNNTPLTFELLKQHKEWIPFLKDKNVLLSLKKKNIGIRGLEQLFEKYGEENAIRIGMKNPESVMKMLENNKFELFSQWYDKLNFIPHYVVMMEFPIEKSDSFISSGKKWSQLMRIERHNLNEESKSALLKASMCFGVFDNDMDGFNKVMQLFTDVPKILSENEMQDLIRLIEEKNGDIELVNKVYGKSEKGSYTLKINSQQNKDVINVIRGIMEQVGFKKVLSPDLAHKLFGGFEMKYEPEFRDFLLKNIETILESDDYIAYISSMQKQWPEIKALNSNRVLTLDLALAFVKSNNYKDVQIGNEKLAEVANQAGYNQQDFETLQQIYNYGKVRIFNSIPRIKNTSDQYTYEVLRLDDPLAVAIGTLTDCCQELGNVAETCMEHSMVSEYGRIFVIKDELGNVVAQSWMWRNQNVVCFDNIEIPAKAFTRSEKSGITREEFTDKIFSIYQQAGKELIEKDEETYSKLLQEGKITEKQYQALKLGKITVGTGYNDIAESLKRNAQYDVGTISRPLEFVPPVELSRGLYTNDSVDQFVIAGEQDVITSFEKTPILYQDEFIIYDNTNTKQQDVLSLQKLEYITKKNNYMGLTQIDQRENIVSSIAYNYDLNPETTKIIMNANFAIIYDISEESVIIGDIFYNTNINVKEEQVDITDKVAMQIRMAIEQIRIKDKQIDVSRLDEEQLEMYNKAINLNEEIDVERGIKYGKR